MASSEAGGECEGIRARRACVRWRSDDVARRGLARILGNFKRCTRHHKSEIFNREAPSTDIDNVLLRFYASHGVVAAAIAEKRFCDDVDERSVGARGEELAEVFDVSLVEGVDKGAVGRLEVGVPVRV